MAQWVMKITKLEDSVYNDDIIQLLNDRTEENPEDASNFYNLACIYATKNQINDVLYYLRVAFRMNNEYIEKFLHDSDFAKIRHKPEIIALGLNRPKTRYPKKEISDFTDMSEKISYALDHSNTPLGFSIFMSEWAQKFTLNDESQVLRDLEYLEIFADNDVCSQELYQYLANIVGYEFKELHRKKNSITGKIKGLFSKKQSRT